MWVGGGWVGRGWPVPQMHPPSLMGSVSLENGFLREGGAWGPTRSIAGRLKLLQKDGFYPKFCQGWFTNIASEIPFQQI